MNVAFLLPLEGSELGKRHKPKTKVKAKAKAKAEADAHIGTAADL